MKSTRFYEAIQKLGDWPQTVCGFYRRRWWIAFVVPCLWGTGRALQAENPVVPQQTSFEYRFTGVKATEGWEKSMGTVLSVQQDGLEIQGSNWDSKIYRRITLDPGYDAVYGAGAGDVMVRLQKAVADEPFTCLHLSGKDWRTDYRDFEAPGGPVFLVVQAWGSNAVARIQWLKVESAPVVPPQGMPDVALFAKEHPSPLVVRGFMSGGGISRKYFADARTWGANVVRLQVFPAREAAAMGKDFWEAWPSFLDGVEKNVQQARDAGVKVIVDLHEPPFLKVPVDQPELWNRPDLEETFCRAWKDLAVRLLPYKETVWAYDLLNEPLDRSQLPWPPRQWRPLAIKIIHAIRTVDPTTWIIYEPGPGSMFRGFEGLVPLPDSHVIYGGHFYYPQEFTHQGVYDIKGTDLAEAMKKINVHYPGVIGTVNWNKEQLAHVLKPADDFQAKWHVPIYVGEFSVIRWAPKEDAVRWLQDVVDLFEARGWSWTYHAFREFNGWSLEHDEKFWMMGSPVAPEPVAYETERAKVIKAALKRNPQ